MGHNFVYLCISLCLFCVLTIPLFSDHFRLQTDASGRGISGVLSVCRDKAELPVAFYSRQLKGGELNYVATELECLAIKESVWQSRRVSGNQGECLSPWTNFHSAN